MKFGEPVFILFKHEDFQPIYMAMEEGDEYPHVTLMVPNARLFYFFLVNFEDTLIEEAPKIYLSETEDVVNFPLKNFFSIFALKKKIMSILLM